ncbi:response regulator transcription factor [Streptomyces sp. NPDC051211]|uniref:response regulator transcription factor n=1 Tax=Streptomyces sp. NPDC051211 TaxID=3154643 RepID=UPI00344BC71F
MSSLLHEGPGIAVVLEDIVQQYGVEAMVRAAAGDSPVFCFTTGTEALAQLDATALDLVVLAAAETDTAWPDAALAELGELGVQLLVLVDGSDEKEIVHASKLCGQGYLDRQDLDTATLSTAITDVLAGRLYVSATLARTLLGRAGRGRGSSETRGTTLTPRELQVLQLLAQGLSNKQVARRLVISEHGVKRLVSNILAKLNCPNRTMAVVRAIQEGLLAA